MINLDSAFKSKDIKTIQIGKDKSFQQKGIKEVHKHGGKIKKLKFYITRCMCCVLNDNLTFRCLRDLSVKSKAIEILE